MRAAGRMPTWLDIWNQTGSVLFMEPLQLLDIEHGLKKPEYRYLKSTSAMTCCQPTDLPTTQKQTRCCHVRLRIDRTHLAYGEHGAQRGSVCCLHNQLQPHPTRSVLSHPERHIPPIRVCSYLCMNQLVPVQLLQLHILCSVLYTQPSS